MAGMTEVLADEAGKGLAASAICLVAFSRTAGIDLE